MSVLILHRTLGSTRYELSQETKDETHESRKTAHVLNTLLQNMQRGEIN